MIDNSCVRLVLFSFVCQDVTLEILTFQVALYLNEFSMYCTAVATSIVRDEADPGNSVAII